MVIEKTGKKWARIRLRSAAPIGKRRRMFSAYAKEDVVPGEASPLAYQLLKPLRL
jgi:hypothetical protein